MPVPWMPWQVAPVGQPPVDGLQIRAHWVGEEDPGVSRTHSGWAVVPEGTSVGHGLKVEHFGEQKSPERPVTWMGCSSDWHPFYAENKNQKVISGILTGKTYGRVSVVAAVVKTHSLQLLDGRCGGEGDENGEGGKLEHDDDRRL